MLYDYKFNSFDSLFVAIKTVSLNLIVPVKNLTCNIGASKLDLGIQE